jgi:hypothetical protein
MKSQLTILMSIVVYGLSFVTTGFAQDGSKIDGAITIETHADADKIAANGGKVYLSSVDLSDSRIEGGGLSLTTTTTAGTVSAGENAQVDLASLLLNDSAVGGMPNSIELEARVGDVMAEENARVDISTISLDGSTIDGDLSINDKVHTTAGTITAGQNSTVAVASLLMGNSNAGSVTIDKLSANIGNLTVEDNAKAYISSLKLDGVNSGEVIFSADTRLDGPITVSEGETLNVNSVVLEDVTVSGGIEMDFQSTVRDGVTVEGDGAEVMVGGVRIGETDTNWQNHNSTNTPIDSQPPDQYERIDGALKYANLSDCVYNKSKNLDECRDRREEAKIKEVANDELNDLGLSKNDFSDPNSGFKAKLYYDEDKHDYVLAFAGTDGLDVDDWENNIEQARRGISKQYKQAMALAHKLNNILEKQGKSLTFTGHSLGGGLASAASMVTGKKAVTFNAAGLHIGTAFLWGQNPGVPEKEIIKNWINRNSLIDAYYVRGKGLNQVQNHLPFFAPNAIGKHIPLDNPQGSLPGGHDFEFEHSIAEVVKALEEEQGENGCEIYAKSD